MTWDDAADRIFNPASAISTVALPGDRTVVVIDEMLRDPDALVAWAGGQAFQPPPGYPYPGVVVGVPTALSERFADHFAQHARTHLQGRRTLAHDVRLSMVTTPPSELDPRQWQCHRDRISMDPATLYVASVLYLFRDPALGGTSFYVPRQSAGATDRIQYDSQTLEPQAFTARYGLAAGYMDGSNAYFECVARVPAAWNRMILYDAGFFHSGDIARPDLLTTDPATGRLTLNGFFTCRRQAR
jgi:hypothetical protein